MVEYQGWLNISQSIDGDSEDDISTIISKIKDEIPSSLIENRIMLLKAINGSFILHCGGLTNHWGHEIESVLSLYKLIAQIAIGSYGVLYYRDDEKRDADNSNRFMILRVARGKCTEFEDKLLSPCFPIIET